MTIPPYVPDQALTIDDANQWFTWTMAWKNGNTSRASNTTPSSDPDLTVPVLANAAYEIRAVIIYDGNGGNQGIQWQWTGIGGGQFTYSLHYWTSTGLLVQATALGATNVSAQTSGTSRNETVLIRGNLQEGNSGPQSFTFQWAQAGASTTATVVMTNSFLMARRVA